MRWHLYQANNINQHYIAHKSTFNKLHSGCCLKGNAVLLQSFQYTQSKLNLLQKLCRVFRTNKSVGLTIKRQILAVWSSAIVVYIKKLLTWWLNSMAFQTSTERNHWLRRCLAIHNGRKCHLDMASPTPFQQLGLLRATEGTVEEALLGA